jgi:membrane protease YdiL (CAAX protease family)
MAPRPLRGAAFEAFIAPARLRPGFWRLVSGLAVALLVALVGAALIILLGLVALGPRWNRFETLVALLSFAALTLGVVLAARLFDGRGAATLIGPGGFRPRAFLAGALTAAGFATGVTLLVFVLLGEPMEQRLGIGPWLGLLPFALLAVLIQTSAEEVAFRAYLAQGLAARFRSPLIWLGVPAALFGAMHWSPAFGSNAPLVVLCAAMIGVILGDVTARTGNLSLAMGLHFGNNLVALLLIAPPAPLDGLALYASSSGPEGIGSDRLTLPLELALLSAGYGLWLRRNRRRNRRRSRA